MSNAAVKYVGMEGKQILDSIAALRDGEIARLDAQGKKIDALILVVEKGLKSVDDETQLGNSWGKCVDEKLLAISAQIQEGFERDLNVTVVAPSEITKGIAERLERLETALKGLESKLDEIEDLRRWKAEAMAVMPDFQEIGKLLGVKVGDSVHDKIIPAIKMLIRLKNEAIQAAAPKQKLTHRMVIEQNKALGGQRRKGKRK